MTRACREYSEHVGWKRQLGGKKGDRKSWYPLIMSIKMLRIFWKIRNPKNIKTRCEKSFCTKL